MRIEISTYLPGTSAVHACDARVKIVLLIAYSLTLFLVQTWWALVVCAAAFFVLLAISRVPWSRVLALSVPLLVIAVFAIVFNAFSSGTGTGAIGFTFEGLARGCFYAVRIMLLVVASLLVSLTTTSTRLTRAFASFLRPLRPLHVPVDDISSVLSIALRFIPLVAEELGRVHDAQWSRGAKFGEGGLVVRVRAWATVLVPLFVGMFRRADNLAVAMDARCYGMPGVARTSLSRERFGWREACVTAIGLAACLALSVVG